jgi:molybdopterin/thiamine biosynthesis adenylyltransferase
VAQAVTDMTARNPDDAARDDVSLARYSRQMLFEPIGEPGQRALKHARVALIGCGALGSVLANTLVRAGVGHLCIIDRDFIELADLQRQILFDEHDVAANLPKVEAAARKLRRINSAVEVEPIVADLNPSNAEALCTDADLILDGTDNFQTRFLLNDVAVKHDLPWIHGGCVAAEGRVMPIIPHQTPCLRCIWDEPPPPGELPTCDTAGVLASAVNVVASLQALEAIKILTGRLEALNRRLVTFDLWTGHFQAIDMQSAYDDGDCCCCKQGRFDFLAGEQAPATATRCGRNAVQVLPPPGLRVDFKQIATRLKSGARPEYNTFMLKFRVDDCAVTLFPDGRAIIQGTPDPDHGRALYAQYIGG